LKRIVFLIFSILFLALECLAREVPVGYLWIDTILNVEMISKKVAPHWQVEDSGLAKEFTYDENTTFPNKWKSSDGESLFLNLGFRPMERVVGELGVEVVGNYADTLYQPINDEHRLDFNKERFRWVKGELKYQGDWLKANLFRGIGHYHWGYEGDIFGLYPEQYDIDTYRRVSGRPIPQGGEITISRFVGGKATVVTGPELVWGSDWSTYARYNFWCGSLAWAMIYKNEKIKWGKENEHLQAGEISAQTKLLDIFPFQFGLLYQPFRVGYKYTYVKASAPYDKNDIKEGETDHWDAIGIKTSIRTREIPWLNRATLTYTYAGLVAGNKHEILLQLEKALSGSLNSTLEFTYRHPVLGPVPYIYEGTEDNPGPPLALPRGANDPFWVNQDNREATLLALFFTYDPTPGTWFYRWQPNILEEWNLNPQEDAKISFALGYFLSYFPTTTDLQTYYSKEGEIVWEPTYSNGMWATKRPIHSFSLIAKVNTGGPKFLINMRGGESLATGGMSYTTGEDKEKPETDFFSIGMGITEGPYHLGFSFGSAVWGPEEWHRRFGETVDRLYRVSLSRTIGKYSTVGIEYIGYRESDGKYIAPELGAFDEIRLFYRLHFSSLFPMVRE